MNLKDRLRHIAYKEMQDRMMGKTTLIAKAAKETGGIMIAHNFDHAKSIERQFGVPARSLDINLEGYNGPFFLDHHATSKMFLRAADKIEDLEKENEKLKEKIENLEAIFKLSKMKL